MSDIFVAAMEIFVLAVVVALITLVGHALWLLFAAVFGALFGRQTRRSEDEVRCRHCRRWTTLRLPRCEWCGHPLMSEAAELAAFRRQLDRLAQEGAIKPEAAQALVAKAEEQRRRRAEAARPQPPAAVVRPPQPGELLVRADVAEMKPPPIPRRVEPASVTSPGPPPGQPAPAAPAATPAVAPAPPMPVAAPAAAAKARPQAPAAPAPPPAPKKPWGEVFLEFLEERNIRLGEFILVIIGGLLIVGGSAAVVISLWHQIKENYLQLAVFVAISSAAFGLGFFTYYRWKLEITGRTWLTIATLLVPLIFLAVVSLSRDQWSAPMLLAEGLSLGLFAYLVGQASRVLVPGPQWPQVVAVVGNAAAVLMAGHLMETGSAVWQVVMAGAVPVTLFGIAMGSQLYRAAALKKLDAEQAGGVFSLLGTGAFALAVAFGLVVAKGTLAEGALARFPHLAPLAAVAATVLLASGLIVVHGTARDPGLAGFRTAGTAVALGGLVAMLAAVLAAWPWPPGLTGVALLEAATLVFVAFRYRMPVAHAGAITAGAIAYLVGFYLVVGEVSAELPTDGGRHLLRLLLDARSGTALSGLFAALAVAAEGLARLGWRRHAAQYLSGAVTVALASLALVTVHRLATGAGRDLDAMAVFGLYGAVSLAMSARWPRKRFTYLGIALLVGATFWGLAWQTEHRFGPIWAAVLAAEALLYGIAGLVLAKLSGSTGGSQARPNLLVEVYRVPLLHSAEAVGGLSLALILATWQMAHPSPTPLVAFGCLAALGFGMAWVGQSALRTRLASAIVLVGLIHTLVENYRESVYLPHLVALLTHATLAVLASTTIRAWLVLGQQPAGAQARSGEGPFSRHGAMRGDAWRVFVEPLAQTGLLSSAMALVVAIAMPGRDVLYLANCLFVLSAIWLVQAWVERWPSLFSAAQVVLTSAVVLAATGWLERHPWDVGGLDLSDPRSLQVYALALGSLSVAWLGVRLALRDNAAARQVLEPPWPAVDRGVGHAVIVGQFLVAGFYAAAACRHELLQGLGPVAARVTAAFGPTGWAAFGIVAVWVIAALWYRWRTAELVAALLAAATLPYLVAGSLVGNLASATAFRWAAALGFVAGAAAIWNRRRLRRLSRKAGARLCLGPAALPGTHAMLLATLAFPTLVLTLHAARLRLAGIAAQGPVGAGLLAEMDIRVSYLVPLLVVGTGLVVLAIRETSAGYAFGGGLVAMMTVVLGYLLHVTAGGAPLTIGHQVAALQGATLAAALWAIVWVALRHRLPVWQEEHRPGAQALMQLQLALAFAGNMALVVPGVAGVALSIPGEIDVAVDWTKAAGSVGGWCALAAALVAAGYRQRARGKGLRPEVAGLAGMGALGLLACTVRGLLPVQPEWAYRTLMLGWAAYAVFVVAATWWIAPLRVVPEAEGPPQRLIRSAARWNVAAGVLAVLLGLKGAFFHPQAEEALWAAAGIALAATACAAMAVWRRQEAWAFAAALGTNGAASLVVWYFQRQALPSLALREWWVRLVQANAIASSSVALVWLAARKRLYELREFSVRTSPLLALQTALGAATVLALGMYGAGQIILDPAQMRPVPVNLAASPGWIGLALAAAATAWYLGQVAPGNLLHVAVGLGLGTGVLLAAAARVHAPTLPLPAWLSPWIGYHTLMAAWAAVALAVLAAGILGRNLRLAKQNDPQAPEAATPEPLLPPALVRDWVTVLGTLAIVLGLLYARADPARPWWSLASILCAGFCAGVLAMWQRRPGYVWLSGLTFNVAATVAWIAWGMPNLASFAGFNVLGLALASIAWSLVRPAHPQGVPTALWAGRQQPFSPAAAILGLGGLGSLTAVLLLYDLFEVPYNAIDLGTWLAAAALAAAMIVLAWDPTAWFAWQGLYGTVLVAYGMALHSRKLPPMGMAYAAAGELAALALAAAALVAALRRSNGLAAIVRLPPEGPAMRSGRDWFLGIQAGMAALSAALATWIAMDPAFDAVAHDLFPLLAGRMTGPLSTATLVLAAALVAHQANPRWQTGWQHATLWLALLAFSGLGWALLPPLPAPWLHRAVVLMVGGVAMTWIAGFGLAHALPAQNRWLQSARGSAKGFAGLAVAALAASLAQEAYLYRPHLGAPMAPAAIVVVAAALVGLIIGCLSAALATRLDPFGLTPRRRQIYVYAAELLLVLVFVHLRLTAPYLFRLGIIARYWMLIALVVAFAGAGLSELFQRRGLAVLSEPLERTALLLPLVPVIGFWLVKRVEGPAFLAGRSPAVWFLTSAFYAFMAATRQSSVWRGLFVLASVVAGNVGLWVLWDQLDWGFFENPQLWLIPVGLSILVAEFLNHHRLSPAQSAGIRYLGLSAIYVPSSIQYLGAIGQSVWLPLVLIGLSLAGVLAGIVLRVRSFLYLGTTFLALVVVTMVRYAAVDLRQTWILYLCCIGLGVAAIALVAFYEKRREAILQAVKGFRRWQR